MVEGQQDGGPNAPDPDDPDQYYDEDDMNPYGNDLFARPDLFYGNPDDQFDGVDDGRGSYMNEERAYGGGMDDGYVSRYEAARGYVSRYNYVFP